MEAHIEVLREHLATWDHSKKTLEEIAEHYNAPRVTPGESIHVPVQCSTAQAVMMAQGTWGAIADAADHHEIAQVRQGCRTVRDAIQDLPALGTDDSRYYTVIGAALSGLVSVGLLSEANKSELMGLADSMGAATERHPLIMDVWLGVRGAPNAVSVADIEEALG